MPIRTFPSFLQFFLSPSFSLSNFHSRPKCTSSDLLSCFQILNCPPLSFCTRKRDSTSGLLVREERTAIVRRFWVRKEEEKRYESKILWGVKASKSEILKLRKKREERTICPHFVSLVRGRRSRSQFLLQWTFHSNSSQNWSPSFLPSSRLSTYECIRKNKERTGVLASESLICCNAILCMKRFKNLRTFLLVPVPCPSAPNNDFARVETSKIWTPVLVRFNRWKYLQKKP